MRNENVENIGNICFNFYSSNFIPFKRIWFSVANLKLRYENRFLKVNIHILQTLDGKNITGIGVLPVIHASEKDVRSKNGILNIFSNKPRIIPNDWTEMNSRFGFPAFGESSSLKEGNIFAAISHSYLGARVCASDGRCQTQSAVPTTHTCFIV